MAECKFCFIKRSRRDSEKRGLEHERIIRREWISKHGGKEYMRQAFAKHCEDPKKYELVKKRVLKAYHKNKRRCSICNRIRPKHYFKLHSEICKKCLKNE